MGIDVLLGLQWGDEGKGKIVDYPAPKYNIVARFQGGPNAGHTLKFDGEKICIAHHSFRHFSGRTDQPDRQWCGIGSHYPGKRNPKLVEVGVNFHHRLFIARKAHLILPTHRYLDAASENAKGKAKIGSTLRGIGPTYMDKTGRNGLRVGDVTSPNFLEKYETLKQKHLNCWGNIQL